MWWGSRHASVADGDNCALHGTGPKDEMEGWLCEVKGGYGGCVGVDAQVVQSSVRLACKEGGEGL